MARSHMREYAKKRIQTDQVVNTLFDFLEQEQCQTIFYFYIP